jgi:hypothetical protein
MGAVKAADIEVLPAVSAVRVGAPGTVRGVTKTLPDASLYPPAVICLSVISYSVPFVKSGIVIGDVVFAVARSVYDPPFSE